MLFFIEGILIQPEIAGILPASFFFQLIGCNQLPQSPLNGTITERRAKLPDVLFVEPPDSILACSAYHFQCGQLGFHKHHAILKVLIGRKDRSEQVEIIPKTIGASYWRSLAMTSTKINSCFRFRGGISA